MTTGLLEFNDLGLRHYHDTELRNESPGYALIEQNGLRFGAEAKAYAKLLPSKINHQFWQQLNLEPLNLAAIKNGSKLVRHRADLAYQHLRSLLTEDTMQPHLLAVPGSFSQEQLGLLLGIVQSTGLPVHGVVDSALLACLHLQQPGRFVHIDVQLHQTVISEIVTDNHLQRRAVEILGASGFLNFCDSWAQGVTEQFIQQTRFNPLHRAETEQQLHDQLGQWLAHCTRSNGDGSLRVQLDNREITLLAAPVLAKSELLYQRIIHRLQQRFGNPDGVIVSDRFAQMPNALNALGEHFRVQALSQQQLADNLQHSVGQLPDNASQTYITQLARPSATPANTAQSGAVKTTLQSESDKKPTHLLVGDHAYRLGQQLFIDNAGQITPDNPGLDNTLAVINANSEPEITPIAGETVILNNTVINTAHPINLGDEVKFKQLSEVSCRFIIERFYA